MNAVEIEEALAELFEAEFQPETFAFSFLRAFGNKDTTIKRLKDGGTNKSDVDGGVLQRKNIHLQVCAPGEAGAAVASLKANPLTQKHGARFVLATDGEMVEAEDLSSGEYVACEYRDFPNHFGVFLPLAGIEMVAEIKDNAVDIRAANRLRRLYTSLFEHNPEWASAERADEMNHFMGRLIFCFFAEDTSIFGGLAPFSETIQQMSEPSGGNVHEVLETLFKSMDTPIDEREAADLPRWALPFPYVNGGLFAGSVEVPRFSRAARSYFLELGRLQWTEINPDIFGSMVQTIADPELRSTAGMHYTSVPNILKVLNPLFLDDLRAHLERAGDNPRKLLNLRKRIARIRVFDPACGSGNFLIIAYKELRAIEAEVNRRRGEEGRASDISPLNFRGIEIGHFAAEIARLSLIIARYQCDAIHLGQQSALREFLPLKKENWIVCGNALRIDWRTVCPPSGGAETIQSTEQDLFAETLEEPTIDFENEGGETYICGNPPYLGFSNQSKEQKADIAHVFKGKVKGYRSLDYVAGWFMRAAEYGEADIALVTTNSLCQGQSVMRIWPPIFETGFKIHFAYQSFKWANLASHNAGVTVAIVGLSKNPPTNRNIYSVEDGELIEKQVENINAYLTASPNVVVKKVTKPLSANLSTMNYGNKPTDGGYLLLSYDEMLEVKDSITSVNVEALHLIRRVYGSREFIRDLERYCLWICDEDLELAQSIPAIRQRIDNVRKMRLKSRANSTQKWANSPHRFIQSPQKGNEKLIVVPSVSSENREYLPVGVKPEGDIVTNLVFALFDAPLWNLALIASRIHLIWIGAVCGKMKTDFRYSNALGWHTFPVPTLTEKNKKDLTEAAERILLAREAHFPASIADLYDGDAMPENLREAHAHNDEVVERIFIGRRFRNDTERLEVLFKRYAELVEAS
ncbi:DNA methyltransferase [Bradymonas sediminis]|uniref:site-specific DNA-methyltransferase (adenine-specific) n=1 Tax=Bradymonas sediminis TaxID=1548548 RepID=A0A2Z4FH62_9DELT|nr:DNA methyltransferase [Bradymonas sediminis]AWV88075.1 lactate dehydrogenase [Bradymonas sediminis]TDP77198.1 hypothetical protein DFR33_10195 [Bradymonas sediminis]